MRHAIRIQPYLSRDLFQKLRAYAAARSLTVSAVVAAALGEYLERDEVEELCSCGAWTASPKRSSSSGAT